MAAGTSGAGTSATRAGDARACAFAVIRRVFEHGAYTDRAFHTEAAALGPRERAFAMQLAYGTVQRRATLDYVAARLVRRPLSKLEAPVLAGLRLGVFQLLYLGGVAPHAAVNETVRLVKELSPRGAGLVNAVLRRAAAEAPAMLETLDDRTPEAAAVLHSVPQWLAGLWWSELGPDAARELLRHCNEPPESALRVNTLVANVGEVTAALPVPSHAAPDLPEGLVVDGAFDAHASQLWSEGAIMPQSRGSMVVARVLAPAAGERILDLCAAPGGKTTHVAALMEDHGEVVAVERHPGRAASLAQTCLRLKASCVHVDVADAVVPRSSGEAAFDRVLVDPPCSGLGTLQSRPDIRWRASPESVAELASLQRRILDAAARSVRDGGTLVYSVCTISRAEGEEVIEALLRERPEFRVDDLAPEYPRWAHHRDPRYLQTLPSRHGTDGFFIARLRRQ